MDGDNHYLKIHFLFQKQILTFDPATQSATFYNHDSRATIVLPENAGVVPCISQGYDFLITGGYRYSIVGDSNQEYFGTTDVIEAAIQTDGSWSLNIAEPLNQPRYLHNSVNIFDASTKSDYTFVIGGQFNGTYLKSVEQMVDGAWQMKPSMIAARSNFAVATVGDEIFAIGGFSEPGKFAIPFIEKFSMQTQTWTRVDTPDDFVKTAGLQAITTRDGKVLILSGGNGKASSTLHLFDPATGKFEEKAKPACATSSSHFRTVDGNKYYLIGG